MKKFFILALLVTMTLSLAACNGNSDNQGSNENSIQKEYTTDKQEKSGLSKVDLFIEEYNRAASNPITDAVEVNVTNKESSHYRTEFRLSAFSDSYAKTGKIGDIIIDIVCYGKDNNDIRVYTDNIDLESAKEIIRVALPILDSDLSSADIQEVLGYLDEYKEANGYYCGDVGIVYLGDLMLKAE